MMRRFLRRWGFLIALAVALAAVHQVALPFVLAVLLAYVLSPAVERLTAVRIGGRRLPRPAAVAALYVGILGALAIFFAAFLPRLSGDFARLFREAPPFFAKVKTEYAPRASAWLERNFPADAPQEIVGPREPRKLEVSEVARGRWEVSLEGLDVELDPIGNGRYALRPRKDAADGRLDEMLRNLARSLEAETMDLLKLGQRFVAGVIKGVAGLVLILMVGGFLLVDKERVLGFLRSLAPPARRDDWDELMVEIDRGLAGVVRGQIAICFINGALTYVGLVVLHVKYAILLGAVAAAMSFIPVFGSILSSIPIVAVALVAGTQSGVDLGRGLGTLGWIIGIHLVEANFLNPKIIGGAAKIHPVVVILALLVGEELGGLGGAVVAVPAASILQTVFLFLRRRSERVDEIQAAEAEP